MGLFDDLKKMVVGIVPEDNEKDIKQEIRNTGGNYNKIEEQDSPFGKLIKFFAFWQKEGES